MKQQNKRSLDIYIADYETESFRFDNKVDYTLESRFLCLINFDSKERIYFNLELNPNCFKDFLMTFTNKKRVRMYFHNLNFDFAFMFKDIPKHFKIDIVMSNSRLLRIQLYTTYKRFNKKTNKTKIIKTVVIELRNSLSIFNESVSTIGFALGFPKLEQDYTIREITSEYIDYCYRDIEIIIKAFEMLIHDTNQMYPFFTLEMKKMPLTISALNKKIFNSLCYNKYGKKMSMKLLYNKSVLKMSEYLRQFYIGGRVEVFNFNVCENGNYNDVNSLYPQAMIKYLIPLGKIEKKPYTFKNIDTLLKLDEGIFAFECIIKETHNIPLIPIKYLDKLLFPSGTKKCFLFRQELEKLIEMNIEIIDVSYIYSCEYLIDIFSDYVNPLYNKKQNSEGFIRELCKIRLNGLYGKMAEKSEKNRFTLLFDLEQDITEKELSTIDIIEIPNNKVLYLKKETFESKYLKTNIIIAMFITSISRLIMYEFLLKADKKLYYTDTDSIVCNESIKYEYNSELGGIKKEFTFSKFQAFAPKEYSFELKNKVSYKMKGFGNSEQKNAVQYKSIENFKENYLNTKIKHRQIGFLESFIRKKALNTFLIQEKRKNVLYDKRWILSDLTTKPFNIDSDNFTEMTENNNKMILRLLNK